MENPIQRPEDEEMDASIPGIIVNPSGSYGEGDEDHSGDDNELPGLARK
jgi:hypothetical protein